MYSVEPIGRVYQIGVDYRKWCHITEYFIFKRLNEVGESALSGDP